MRQAVQTNIELTLGLLVLELLGSDGVGAVPVPAQDLHLCLLLVHRDLSLSLVGGGWGAGSWAGWHTTDLHPNLSSRSKKLRNVGLAAAAHAQWQRWLASSVGKTSQYLIMKHLHFKDPKYFRYFEKFYLFETCLKGFWSFQYLYLNIVKILYLKYFIPLILVY